MSSTFLISAPLSGSVSAAWSQHTAIRFASSGLIGNAVFYGLDKILFPVILRISDSNRAAIICGSKWINKNAAWINKNAASVSFFLAYLLDIAVQHFLNAWLVFGLDTICTRELYFSSLATTYTAYFGTLCGSTVLQSFLLRWGLSHHIAFGCTIAVGSLVNYVILTALNAVNTSSAESAEMSSRRCTEGGSMAMVPNWTAKRAIAARVSDDLRLLSQFHTAGIGSELF